MRELFTCFSMSVILCLCLALDPKPEMAALAFDSSPDNAAGAEMSRGGSSAFVPPDPDLNFTPANVMIDPDVKCTNCLIRLCLIGSNNKLTGYCLEGARGGICHQAYNPSRCPPGAAPRKPVQSPQCGFSGKFLVDGLRSCS